MGTKLVIVESPAKARKIGSFLGDEYVVEASVGHIRDLPQRAADIPKEFKQFAWAKEGVNIDEAIENYERALKLNPKKIEAYYNIGNSYCNKNDFKKLSFC